MASKPRLNVVWHLTNDGLVPSPAPWGFIVRNPVGRAIPPDSEVTIRTNVACNYPMFAWPVRNRQDDLTVPMVIPAGQEIVVTVRNNSKHTVLTIDDKEALVCLHPPQAVDVTSECA